MNNKKISLGFTDQKFDPGVHICQIFGNEEERHSALVDFIISGIEANENTACYTEKESDVSLENYFESKGISYKEAKKSGKFSLSKTAEVYFADEKFDPDRMVNLLKEFYNTSISNQKSGARVIGEMTPQVEKVKGGSRLLEYESKISLLTREYPVNAVCQYDAREFDGATIMDILKVHPYMIVKGSVVHNPFYIEPEEYLGKKSLNN